MKDKEILIVGILNLNKDSFYDGGKYIIPEIAFQHAKNMIIDGANIIEIWGFSTKPWSVVPSVEEELSRIIPTLELINSLNFPISVETSRHEIVAKVLNYKNVILINDTSWLKDIKIISTIKKLSPKVGYVLMHNPVNYKDINNLDPLYNKNITEIINDFFIQKINIIRKFWYNNIIIDPGFYFHKSVNDNLSLIKNLSLLKKFDLPIFIALSRKSCILEINKSSNNLALIETCIMNFECMKHWATYIRVHDISEAVYIRKLFQIYDTVI